MKTPHMDHTRRTEMLWAFLFISPLILGKLVFYLLPAAASLVIAFTEWNGLTQPVFAGLDNFQALANDRQFIGALANTVIFSAIAVPLSISVSTVLAVLLNQKIQGKSAYRTIYFLPVVSMPIAVGMVWRWLYNSEHGLLNVMLRALGLPQPSWLFDTHLILMSIAFVWVWQNIGYNIVLLLSGLQGISSTYYESAELDGCGGMQKFFYITLPLLTPTLFFVVVITLINSLQVFDLTYIMMENISQSTLVDHARTIVYSIYENGFQLFNMGYATTQGWVLFFMIMAITLVQMIFQKKWVHYQ